MSGTGEASRYDTEEFRSSGVSKRMDMWLQSCMCDTKESPFCTYCTILWDARERMEMLESIACGYAFNEGMYDRQEGQ